MYIFLQTSNGKFFLKVGFENIDELVSIKIRKVVIILNSGLDVNKTFKLIVMSFKTPTFSFLIFFSITLSFWIEITINRIG